MKVLKTRLNYLFGSTKGLILVAIAMISLVTAIWGMLSGPMAEMGIREVVVKTLNMDIVHSEREGRIVILYHTIAMAVIAIETYMITSLLKMKNFFIILINMQITVGYILAMVFGLGFAYFGHSWIFHGLYIAGLTLVFFAGVLLAVALWPWNKAYYVQAKDVSRTKKGMDLERAAFFMMTITTLISAMFGAIPGAFYGNGFETFLAENIIRYPDKTPMEYSIIGHLHIMLALISIAATLIIGRWLNFKSIYQKIAMPLIIIGTFVLNAGVWLMPTPLHAIGHIIIYVGATPAMLGALLLVIFGWDKLIREGVAGIEKPTLSQKLGALVRDPLKFGPLWQMVFMNFNVSGIGIFMAVKLDEIFRVWPAREERIELTGHWHILSAIVATIILLYYGDIIGLKGKVRKFYGWGIIISSDIAFGAMTIYEMKRLFVTEALQQPLVNKLLLLSDLGLGMLLVILAMVMVWRLIDLFKNKGRWTEEQYQNDLYAEVK